MGIELVSDEYRTGVGVGGGGGGNSRLDMRSKIGLGSRRPEGRADNGEVRAIYIDLVRNLAVERAALTEREWEDKWRSVVKRIVEDIVGVQVTDNAVDGFLNWGGSEGVEGGKADRKPSDNLVRFPQENPVSCNPGWLNPFGQRRNAHCDAGA